MEKMGAMLNSRPTLLKFDIAKRAMMVERLENTWNLYLAENIHNIYISASRPVNKDKKPSLRLFDMKDGQYSTTFAGTTKAAKLE